jgi:uncharacterized protein (TIGR02996 family)
MSDDETRLLEAIREAPDDDAARLVYADFLDANGDPRGELVRIEMELLRLKPRLAELKRALDPEWVAAVTRRVALVLVGGSNDRKIMMVKAVREATGLGLKETVDIVTDVIERGRPHLLLDGIDLDESERLERLFDGIATVRLEMRPHRVSSDGGGDGGDGDAG